MFGARIYFLSTKVRQSCFSGPSAFGLNSFSLTTCVVTSNVFKKARCDGEEVEGKKGKEEELMKILVVDDELPICDLLYEFLSLQGYQVTTATNGREAISKFEENCPDVVILDIRMPEMNGIEVLQKIKEIDSNAKVIMLSAFGDSKTIEKALQMGASYYMEKPLEFDRLMKILNAL